MTIKLPEILHKISTELQQNGACAVLVGGSVRDHFLNIPIKDYDIEVYGLHAMYELENILKKYGNVNFVGKSFGVLKFVYEGEEYDFAFPRREKKIAKGHKGFDVVIDGHISFKEAAIRRDFTINSMGYDIISKRILDPFGGREDLRHKRLRHIHEMTFVEDPLRVYRGVQFCARFDLIMDPMTKQLCQQMVSDALLDELPKERVYGEFIKILLKSNKPSIGFEYMKEIGILNYFPELKGLIGIAQDPIRHPEGDVWSHTMLSIDVMAKMFVSSKRDKLILMFAVLCHDFGKAVTTQKTAGKICTIGSETASVQLAKSFLFRLTDEIKLIENILQLVHYHLLPSKLFAQNASETDIRKLAVKVNIKNLVLVAKADFLGRTTKEALQGEYQAGEWLLKKAKSLGVLEEAPKPLLQGRDLIEIGLVPSPKFKEILDKVYEVQLEGQVTTKEDALLYVKKGYL